MISTWRIRNLIRGWWIYLGTDCVCVHSVLESAVIGIASGVREVNSLGILCKLDFDLCRSAELTLSVGAILSAATSPRIGRTSAAKDIGDVELASSLLTDILTAGDSSVAFDKLDTSDRWAGEHAHSQSSIGWDLHLESWADQWSYTSVIGKSKVLWMVGAYSLELGSIGWKLFFSNVAQIGELG
jgi:hypothetical protein